MPDPQQLLRVARDAIRSDAAVRRLAELYYGELPIDDSFRDEEYESTVAMRKATERATAELGHLAGSFDAALARLGSGRTGGGGSRGLDAAVNRIRDAILAVIDRDIPQGGGSGAGDPEHGFPGFPSTGSACEPSGAASTSRGGDEP